MSTPTLYYQHGGIAERVLSRCSSIKLPFNPTLWAPNGHMQSALGLLRTLSARGSYTRQLVMTSDHGTLGLDWWCGGDKPTYAAPDAPIVLFIHGINGGSHEGYVKWACVAAAARGWRAVVLNMRGCNGVPITSARGYNAINTGDLHVAVQSIRSRFPAAPLMAAGYSLGSVLLAKYLAEADNGLYADQHQQQQQQPSGKISVAAEAASHASSSSSMPLQLPDLNGSGLVAAALVSPPVCLHTTNSKMGNPYSFKFLYNLAVAYKLREYVREHGATMQQQGVNVDMDSMSNSWTVSSFDEAVTLKTLGYPAPHYYYRHACGTNYIPHIRTPTVIMVSRDDPFLGVLPREQAQHNPFTLLAATRRGGHLAFLQGWWPLGASYCDNVIDDWMQAALQEWKYGLDTPAALQQQQQQQQDAMAAVDRSSAGSSRAQPAPAAINPKARSSHAARSAAARLPSWVERAQSLGWQRDVFDPHNLAHAMCSCHPELDPLAEAKAADALLNVSPAVPVSAAVAAGRAAARQARSSWSFGFASRGAGRSLAAKPVLRGLRENGAWAPFDDDDDLAAAVVGSGSTWSSFQGNTGTGISTGVKEAAAATRSSTAQNLSEYRQQPSKPTAAAVDGAVGGGVVAAAPAGALDQSKSVQQLPSKL